MKRIISYSLVLVLAMSLVVSGQNATIWGVGDDYEIDYLHSGRYVLDGEQIIDFQDEPSTEFTINNVTNDGYDYSYIGYGGVSTTGTILMQSFNFGGFASLTLPTGDMPVMLPLAYGEEDDWIANFAEKLNELSKLNTDNEFLNANVSLLDDKLIMEYFLESNSSITTDDTLFALPSLQPEEFSNANNTLVNSTLQGDIRYEVSTGVLFSFNITINAEELLVDDIGQGSVNITQRLEFVAIIPPVSIIDEFPLEITLLFGILVIYPISRLLRND